MSNMLTPDRRRQIKKAVFENGSFVQAQQNNVCEIIDATFDAIEEAEGKDIIE